MKAFYASSLRALPLIGLTLALASPTAAQTANNASGTEAEESASNDLQVAEVVVTAQRRTTDLQDTSAAITAIGGATLDKDRVLSFEDLAGRATSLSFTARVRKDPRSEPVFGSVNTAVSRISADASFGR